MNIFEEDLTDDALEFATKAHSGQFRRNGKEYIEHPKAVAAHVKRVKPLSHKIDTLQAAAYLHDTREDTEVTDAEILEQFGPEVLTLVHELTSDEKELARLGKTQYLKKKFSGISSWALVIKLADRLDNVSDLLDADPEWARKYTKQTQEILQYLEQNRMLTKTQQKLVDEIRSMIVDFVFDMNESKGA